MFGLLLEEAQFLLVLAFNLLLRAGHNKTTGQAGRAATKVRRDWPHRWFHLWVSCTVVLAGCQGRGRYAQGLARPRTARPTSLRALLASDLRSDRVAMGIFLPALSTRSLASPAVCKEARKAT